MNLNSDVAKTELQLLHPGYLAIFLISSKKIPGIKNKAIYLSPNLDIVSIQIGANSLNTGDNKLNIDSHVTLLYSVNLW